MKLTVGAFNMAAGLNPDINQLGEFLVAQNFDILALQEVDEMTDRYHFYTAHLLAERLGMQSYFSEAMPFQNGKYGIALLVPGEILASATFAYSKFGVEPRVFQKIKAKIGGHTLHLFNTHLSFETPQLRQQQMNELVGHLDTPALVFGDFNTDQSVNEWEAFQLPLAKINGAKNIWSNTFQVPDATMKTAAIDNILFSAEFVAQGCVVVATTLSDHALLQATFTLEK